MIDGILALLIAALLAWRMPRYIALAAGYAAARFAFVGFAPAAANSGPEWYLYCVAGEALIIMVCLMVRVRASRYVGRLSTMGIIVHLAAMGEWLWFPNSYIVYTVYPWAIQGMEALQLIVMALLSPFAADRVVRVRQWIDNHREIGSGLWRISNSGRKYSPPLARS